VGESFCPKHASAGKLSRYTGKSPRVQVLEVENACLKAELDQAIKKSVKSDADHCRAREEWTTSCAKMNEELRSRAEAYRRHQAEVIQCGRQLQEARVEIEVLNKAVSAVEDDKSRLAAALKRREEEVFWFLDQGVAGAIQSFRSNPEYVEVLTEFNVTAEFVGRVEGFEDGFRYASEGKPKTDCPYLDPEAESKRTLAQTAFENVQVPLLQAIVDCAPDLNVDRAKELVFPEFSEESDDPNGGSDGVGRGKDEGSKDHDWCGITRSCCF
jgi:hypothetical protein